MNDEQISTPETTTTPPQRPAPASVGFVWHPILNEEREDSSVLPSERLRQAYHLLEVTGALHWREVKTITADLSLGKPDALLTFHTPFYYQSVLALSERRANLWHNGHDDSNDNGVVSALNGTITLAGASVATTRSAVRYALQQPAVRVFTPAGQQAHAAADHIVDGHIFNDVLFALRDARTAGKKVAFLNLDVEHPRLIQEQFESDKGLLFISLHENSAFLYPYTGIPKEMGKGEGIGYTVNLPMPPGAGDVEYKLVIESIVVPLLQQFAPDILIVIGGTTAHFEDPASHLTLTSKGYQATISTLMQVAPRFVLLGGDGTNYSVAARLWAIALATLAERTNSLPPQIPAAHARLWAGGMFHDTERPHLTDEYRSYSYGLLRGDLQQAMSLLQQHWQLPSLEMPDKLDLPRERIRVERAAGETVAFQPKDLHLPFGGMTEDEDDDARRTPKQKAKPSSQEKEAVEEKVESVAEIPADEDKPRERRHRGKGKGNSPHLASTRPADKSEGGTSTKPLSRHRPQPRHPQGKDEPPRDTPSTDTSLPSATPPHRPRRARPRRNQKP